MKRIVILNPQSRHGKAAKLFDTQREEWEARLGGFKLHQTKAPGDATLMVNRALKNGETDQIIVAGGDGTINEAFRGYWDGGEILNSTIPLGIINLGTGGDFIRTVEAKSDDYPAALAGNRFRKVDAARVSIAPGKNHHFLNVASVGMAGDMLRSLKDSKFQNGSGAYFYHSLKTLLTFDPKQATVELIGHEGVHQFHQVDIINFFVCNGQYSGGGMQWAPGAKLDDGLLRITLIGGKRKMPLILQSQKLYTGQIESFPGAETFIAKEVIVKCDNPLSLETDGEIIETDGVSGGEIRFKVIEGAFPLVI